MNTLLAGLCTCVSMDRFAFCFKKQKEQGAWVVSQYFVSAQVLISES